MELGHLLTRSGPTYPEVSSKVCHDSFCQLGNSVSLPWVICPASSHETCQWLKFPPNRLRAQSRVSPVVGLLPSASGPACLGMVFPPFLMKQLYRCDLVVISSFVRTGYTTDDCLGRIGYSITHHYPLYPTVKTWKWFGNRSKIISDLLFQFIRVFLFLISRCLVCPSHKKINHMA